MSDSVIEIFYGQATSTACRVYAQMPLEGSGDIVLSGHVQGPLSPHAKTLPATVRFHMLPPGPTVLAEAILPDPCFWLPSQPYQYHVEVQARRGDEVIASERQSLGIRPLGSSGRSLLLNGQRFVPRGVALEQITEEDWQFLRESRTALVLRQWDDNVLTRAGDEGVLVLVVLDPARISAAETAWPEMLQQLRRFPAVGIMAWRGGPANGFRKEGRSFAKNIVLAGFVENEGSDIASRDWAQAAICPAEYLEKSAAELPQRGLPLLAWRCQAAITSAAEGRAECDRLQRDLASHGDFAGYLVTHW